MPGRAPRQMKGNPEGFRVLKEITMTAVWDLWNAYLQTHDVTPSNVAMPDNVLDVISDSPHCHKLIHTIFTAITLSELLPDEIMCEFLIICPERQDEVWQDLVAVFTGIVTDQHLYRSISHSIKVDTGHSVASCDAGLVLNWQQLLPTCWKAILDLLQQGQCPTRHVFRCLLRPTVADLVIALADLIDASESHEWELESRSITLHRYLMKVPRPPEPVHKPHSRAKQLRLNLACLQLT